MTSPIVLKCDHLVRESMDRILRAHIIDFLYYKTRDYIYNIKLTNFDVLLKVIKFSTNEN